MLHLSSRRRASSLRARREGQGRKGIAVGSGLRALVLLCACLLFAPAAAEARYERRSSARLPLDRVEIVGNEAFSRKRVLKLLPSLKGSLFRAARYSEARLLSDIDKLVDAYQAAGYLDVVVHDPQTTFLDGRKRVAVTIRIDEGRRSYVGTVGIEGCALVAAEELDAGRLIAPGAPLDRSLLPSDAYRIYSHYADGGLTYARVTYDTTRTAPDTVSILFHVVEGDTVFIGELSIVGNERTLGRAIARELRVKEDDPFSRRRILESQASLYGTGLFSSAEFIPDSAAFAERARRVDLTVRVRERKLRWFGLGVGYGTTDFLRVSGDWNNKNLFGTGRQLELKIVASRLFSSQRENYRSEVTLVNPWFVPELFGPRTNLGLSVFHDRRDVENFEIRKKGEREGDRIERYRLRETGLRANLSRDLSPRLRAWVGFNLSWADAQDPSEPIEEDLLQPEQKRSLDGTAEWIVRDNLFDPTRGWSTRGYSEYAGFGGDSEFLRLRGSTAIYRPLPLRGVLALRAEVGGLWPQAGATGLPDHERFRLGGATTVRGYGEDQVGPGNFLLLSNVEWRVRLFWQLSAAAFLDGGNAWGTSHDIKGDDFRLHAAEDEVTGDDVRYGAGGGLRLTTPVGPARLDYGRKLKEVPGEDAWAVHLSLGQPF